MVVRHEFSITFRDADPAGIAFYPRIAGFCHLAFEIFFEKTLGENYAQIFMQQNVGYPTVKLDMEFKAPMRFGDSMAADIEVAQLADRTVTFQYQFIRRSDGVLCATARNLTVCADRIQFKSRVIPENHARVFREHFATQIHDKKDSSS